jgi:uncharacterized membrane protein
MVFRWTFWCILLLLLVPASSLHASNGPTAPVRQLFVFLHVFGAVIFMGNIIVTAMWMTQAKRTRDAAVLHFASQSVIRADWLFTLPGILLILISGLFILGPHGGFPGPSWVELALTLLILSGLIWVLVLIRLQRTMVRLSAEAMQQGFALSGEFTKTLGRWMMWGGIATLLPLVALYLMVFKPKLWG